MECGEDGMMRTDRDRPANRDSGRVTDPTGSQEKNNANIGQTGWNG
jgi:hypothetical protein